MPTAQDKKIKMPTHSAGAENESVVATLIVHVPNPMRAPIAKTVIAFGIHGESAIVYGCALFLHVFVRAPGKKQKKKTAGAGPLDRTHSARPLPGLQEVHG